MKILHHLAKLQICAKPVASTIAAVLACVATPAFGDNDWSRSSRPTRLPAVTSPPSQSQTWPSESDQNQQPAIIANGSTVQRRQAVGKLVSHRKQAATSARDPSAESKPAQQDQLPATSNSSHATRWLRSTTSSATFEIARRLLSQASEEYRVGAWLSAETSAWDALYQAASALDLSDRERGADSDKSLNTSLQRLSDARTAIREARDFSGKYGELDSQAVARISRSHQTNLLDDQPILGLTAADASDRYLDAARIDLASLASRSVEAAQAMDLIAAVLLNRADPQTLPSATALCLRRAALQGQPENASLASRLGMHLADLGLLDEARWALEHSLQLEADRPTAEVLATVLRRSGHSEHAAELIAAMQNQSFAGLANESNPPRVPQIVEVSPAEFAAMSKPVVPFQGSGDQIDASLVSAKSTASQDDATGRRRNTWGIPVSGSRSPWFHWKSTQHEQRDGNGNQDGHRNPYGHGNPYSHGNQVEQPGMVSRFLNKFRSIW